MTAVNPKLIPGRWRHGYALDHHTSRSIFLGDDEYGHPQFETERTHLGELLFQLKYRGDNTAVDAIADAAAAFVTDLRVGVDVIVPVPPSRHRPAQPVNLIALALAQRLRIPCAENAVVRVCEVPEMKDVYEYSDRIKLLAGAFDVVDPRVRDNRILLFDDLFRSGATMNAVSAALFDKGGAADVFALAITKTRSNQ